MVDFTDHMWQNLDGNVSTYNGSTMWLIGDALLYYQEGLDPQTTHTVNITPRVGGGLKFWLNSVTLLADSGNAIAGGTNRFVPLTRSVFQNRV